MSTHYTESKYPQIFRVNVFFAFVFLNILTPIVLAKSFSQYYSSIRANVSAEDFTKCLYQATAFASFLCNVAYTTFSIWNYFVRNDPAITACVIFFSKHPCTIPSGTSAYRDEVITLLAKLIIIPLAIFVELLMSIYIVRRHSVIMVQRYDHMQISFLESLLASITSCFGTVEHYDHHTVGYHDCYPPHCTTIDTPPSNNVLFDIFDNGICVFDNHCFLCVVLVSAVKKEKGLLKYKVLWKDFCTVCCDCCNPGTDHHTSYCI